MYCFKCGAQLQEGLAFCTVCGASLDKNHGDSPDPTSYTGATSAVTAPGDSSEPETVILEPEPETADDSYTVTDSAAVSYQAEIVTLEPVPDPDATQPPAPDPQPTYTPLRALGIALLSVLFGMILFGFVCAFVTMMIVRPANLPKVIVNADVTWIMQETGLDEVILFQVNESYVNDLTIDIYDIDEFLKRENVSEQLSKAAEGYIKAISEGNTGYYISSREIAAIMKALAPDIRDQFNYKMTDEDYDFILNSLDEQVDLKEYRVGNILQEANVDIAIPAMALSIYPLLVTGILCALLIFDIFLLHRKKVRTAFLTTGIPIILAGLIIVTAGSLIGPFNRWVYNTEVYKLTRLSSGIARIMLTHGLICFLVGVLSLVAFFVIRSLRKNRPPKAVQEKSTKAWVMTGLITNTALILVCAVITFLFYWNFP